MRTNLAVPFQEKDEAKRLGARWDYEARTWYVEDVENLEQFLRWIPQAKACNASVTKALRKRYRKPAEFRTIQGPTTTGDQYKPSCGKCQLPPWEVCACSFTAADRAEADARLDQFLEMALQP